MTIRISKLWIIVLPIIISLHLYKVLLFIFLLLSIHEMMHILCANMLGYETKEVKVYPMGLSARIKDFEYKKSFHEILITLAGLSIHIIMYFLLQTLAFFDILSYPFMEYLNTINLQILCFNCIPIYPLDGGRIIRNFFEIFFPYKRAKWFSLLSSFLMLFYLINKGLLLSFSGIILFSFFVFQLGMALIFYRRQTNDFFLYRFIHGFKGKPIFHTHDDIYKNKENYILQKGTIKNEREYLGKFF